MDSATEEQVAEFLSRLRQDIKDYYRPPETPTRITMIDPIEHHYGGLISHMMAVSRLMRYSGPPLKMMEIDYSSIEKRILGHELSGVWIDEGHYVKPTKMGAGKNPFAERHISKHKK